MSTAGVRHPYRERREQLMAERCDACMKRRKVTMHPLGLDLCEECTAYAAELRATRQEQE